MEILLDSANLKSIKRFGETLPLAGVTTNPSIIKKEGKIDFFAHLRKIRTIIGPQRSLHVQVVATDVEGILKDAEAIFAEVGEETYVKVPVTEEGLKAIKALKDQRRNVTATAIYTIFQADLAVAAGADYIAPYFNRMENLNIDAEQAVREMAGEIKRSGAQTKILAASFKNIGQVTAALRSGAQAVTAAPDVIAQGFAMPSIAQAVADFTHDWENIFGEGQTIASLRK